METEIKNYAVKITDRKWLSKKTFELKLSRPTSFEFKPGQRIRLCHPLGQRDYTPVSAPGDPEIILCIRSVERGILSPMLGAADIGTELDIAGPYGYFTFKPSRKPPVFVATGTGIAPFGSMMRSGVTGFILLHGVDTPDDLYYLSEFKAAAKLFVPCISKADQSSADCFRGRVSDYLQQHLPATSYDFYLCGRREMIRDVTWLVDERFPGSLVYTELFY